MLRDFADVFVIVSGLLTLSGVGIRLFFKRRRSPNLEHIRQLEVESKEIDAALDRLRKGDKQP